MKIWCLFSQVNDYNQPGHNLVAWWVEKPTLGVLFQTMDLLGYSYGNSQEAPAKILKGEVVRLQRDDTDYWLEEIEEGKVEDR